MIFFAHYIEKNDPDRYHHLITTKTLSIFCDELFRIVNEFTLVSHSLWALWAIVQSCNSPIDFDFLEYARLRFAGYYYHKSIMFHQ